MYEDEKQKRIAILQAEQEAKEESTAGKQADEFLRKGEEKYWTRDFDGAVAEYTRAIDLNPSSFAAYHDRGVARYMQEKYKDALLDLSKAIELKPQTAKLYESRGYAHMKIGNMRDAVIDWEQAARMDPQLQDSLKVMIDYVGK